MIDYEKLSFWIGTQLDDLKTTQNDSPNDMLYGAIKAYESIYAQLNLAWSLQKDD